MIAIFPFFIQLIEIVSVALGADPLNQVTNNELVNVSRYIANGHSIFNILSACVFLIFLPWLIRVAIMISPKEDKESDELRLPNFDHRFLDTPIAALTKARSEIIKMSDVAMKMLKNTIEAFEKRDSKKLNKWRRYEDHLDSVQREITSYLTRIYQSDLNQSEAREISSMMRMTNNIERVGDSIENIALMIEDIIENKTDFSSQAIFDIKKISNQVVDFIALVQEGIRLEPTQFMKQAQILEDNIDFMREEMRQNHIERLRSGTCANEPGLMFSDMLSNFEKMGDYCYNIAQAVARIK
ncbi:MAG: Na/Pi cotransporter family protein [Deltaproteobacteria bacterium]|nr:Na/Pi cotransporter family protein [Deltaproteobacteria bacterium]